MESFSTFRLCVLQNQNNRRWYYAIYSWDGLTKIPCQPKDTFDSEGEARYAAIGHITLLENTLNNSEPPRS